MSSEPAKYKWLFISALLVLAAQLIPEVLEYDRQNPGQFWRFFTSHFVHWNLNHLCWDLLLFLVLGYLLIKEDHKIFQLNLIICPWIISLLLWVIEPNMRYYRGISGIDAALYTSLACIWLKSDDKFLNLVGLIQLILISAKIIYEFTSQEAFFADSSTYKVMPWAHLGGVLCSYFTVFFIQKKESPEKALVY